MMMRVRRMLEGIVRKTCAAVKGWMPEKVLKARLWGRVADAVRWMWTAVGRRVSREALAALGVLMGGVILMSILGIGVAWYEYRTNQIAVWMGGALADMNARRQPVGRVWRRLGAQAEARDTIHAVRRDGVAAGRAGADRAEGGFPEAVVSGRFEIRRIPEAGMPGYVVVVRTPVGSGQRDPLEVGESFRIFRQGLSLLRAAKLPDVRYRSRVQEEVARLYGQLGDLGGDTVAAGDTLGAAQDSLRAGDRDSTGDARSMLIATESGDTLEAMHPDLLQVAVLDELAQDMTDRLRREEHARLLADFQAGRVGEIVLHRGLGVYQCEATYDDPETPAVTFEVDAQQVIVTLEIEVSDGQ